MYTASLDNGLRIIFQPSESEVVYCGYVICAGTRHEAPEDSGMAHFIEHMSFKGTQRRKSRQINDYLERVGGELNAFTSKQETVYCATVLRRDVHRAVDILTDMVFHSVYPQNEIEKEVEVIIDEIDSYKDSPSELIFDEFEQLLFGDTSLRRDILGDKNRLRRLHHRRRTPFHRRTLSSRQRGVLSLRQSGLAAVAPPPGESPRCRCHDSDGFGNRRAGFQKSRATLRRFHRALNCPA